MMSANRSDEGDAQTDAEIVNKVLEHHANHSTNCGTEADPDDGFGYCTPGCRVYAAREAFNRILARALPEEQPDPTP